jgi:small-conductance mechanosensitive channel
VVVDDLMGTVEHVGIKTTRLRSINGEQLIFSNKDLTNSRLKNYKRMENRRVVFSFSVTYSTPTDKLRMIPEKVKNIIDGIDNARFDRAHLKELGDSSLVFEAAYYVLSQDYNLYMDIQQSIIFALKDELEMLGAEFAFPARTVYLQNKS